MKFRIHFTLSDDTQDSVVITADTIEELQTIAAREVAKRAGRDPWEEELAS